MDFLRPMLGDERLVGFERFEQLPSPLPPVRSVNRICFPAAPPTLMEQPMFPS